ncbi:hypothetical protein Efla_005170 [Eimeria flavescens]
MVSLPRCERSMLAAPRGTAHAFRRKAPHAYPDNRVLVGPLESRQHLLCSEDGEKIMREKMGHGMQCERCSLGSMLTDSNDVWVALMQQDQRTSGGTMWLAVDDSTSIAIEVLFAFKAVMGLPAFAAKFAVHLLFT